MKARKMLAGIWAVVMLLSGLGIAGFMTLPVVAQPNAHQFSGSILINGIDAPAGTFVYAEIDGTLYGQDSDQVGGGYQAGAYGLAVSGEDPANPIAKEGGIDGENVIFWVLSPMGGPYIANQAASFLTGGISNVDLTVQTATQPPRVRMDQINITTGDWVLLYNPSPAATADLSQGWSIVDSYMASSGALSGSIPPMSNSPMTYSVAPGLMDTDGNVKLVWRDPLGTIAGGVDVVMDKAEWGTHLADTEGTGGETIGLDKGDGSVWDPNLPDPCPPDMGFWRVDANVDTDIREDFNWTGTWCHYLPGINQPPELWPDVDAGPGYLTDYLEPEVGDTTTTFVWRFQYSDNENNIPEPGNPPELRVWDFLTGLDVAWSPADMVFLDWRNPANPNVYQYPDGAIYTYADTINVLGTDYRYQICATDEMLRSNCTAVFDAPDVGDAMPPVIEYVNVDGGPTTIVQEGDIVDLRVKVNDTTTGGSNIGGADWLFTCGPWPGNATIPEDGSWDSPEEIGMYLIDTTGLGDGDWIVNVRAWDVIPNYNGDVPPCETATITVTSIDQEAPVTSSVLLNLQDPLKVKPGTSVDLTAFTDDTADPENYLIGGAEYSINPPSAPIPMTASDTAFDEESEDVTATIDTTPMSDGVHLICVYAWDTQTPPNKDNTGVCANLVIDGTPPQTTALTINGQAISADVQNGTNAYINATIDDSGIRGDTDIDSAYWTYGALNFPGTLMAAVDGAYDNPLELVTYTLATGVDPYYEGVHTICVYGNDALWNNDTTTGRCITLNILAGPIIDDEPPLVFVDDINGQPAIILIQPGTALTLNGTVDDSTMGGSHIANASYIVRDGNGVTYATNIMSASDGLYGDSPQEGVTAVIATGGWPEDNYTVHILACDTWSTPNCNYNETEFITVRVSLAPPDTEPPEVSNVVANPATFMIGTVTTITLTATIDDTSHTPSSPIASAEYTVGAAQFPGVTMDATDGLFDEETEDVTITIDVSGWTVGTYDLYVYASDASGNDNTTSVAYATVTVQPFVDNPPDITGVNVPSTVDEDSTVTITVTAEDDHTTGENLTVVVTVTNPDGTDIVTNVAMTYNSATDDFTYTTPVLTVVGSWTFIVNVTDESSQSDEQSGGFTVREVTEPPKDEIPWWIWLLIILIIIIVIVLIAVAATRKKPEEELPPAEEIEEVEELPPEEEVFVEEEMPPEEIPPEEAPPEEFAPEEAPPEEVAPEEAPPEEVTPEEVGPEEVPPEEVTEEAPPAEEAAPAGPISCPNCGTVNPEGSGICGSCGSPL